jgi:hypothetical protein
MGQHAQPSGGSPRQASVTVSIATGENVFWWFGDVQCNAPRHQRMMLAPNLSIVNVQRGALRAEVLL